MCGSENLNFLKFKGTQRFSRQSTMISNQSSNISEDDSDLGSNSDPNSDSNSDSDPNSDSNSDVIDVVKQVLFEELKIEKFKNGISENKFKTIRRSQMKIRQAKSIPNLSITYSSFSQNNDMKRGVVKPGHVTRLVTKFEE